MISNPIIGEKIEEKTKNDEIMRRFLFDIINHENENMQFSKQYKKLIEKAVKEKEGKGLL